MAMFVICDPPLGHVTVVEGDAAKFTVLLQSSQDFSNKGCQVVLWHNVSSDGRWGEFPLEGVPEAVSLVSLKSNKYQPELSQKYFTGRLPRSFDNGVPHQFTIKFCVGDGCWRWVNDIQPQPDGELLFQCPEPVGEDFKRYFQLSDNDVQISLLACNTPHTSLWSITTSVNSGYTDVKLGQPLEFSRWFSLVQISSPWLGPRHGRTKYTINEDAILSSFLRLDGLHVVVLAVSGLDDIWTVFKSDGGGNMIIHARNDRPKTGKATILAGVGKNFEVVIAAIMEHLRNTFSNCRSFTNTVQVQGSEHCSIKPGGNEMWYEGLTYCTWNGLGQDLNEQKIFDALDVLESNDIRITNLIIDDNWQSLDYSHPPFERSWTDFEANQKGFPHGLKNTISTIRKKHKNIHHIAVWHALYGYWGGVSNKGTIGKTYKTREVKKQDGLAEFLGEGRVTVVDAEDVYRMYQDFYAFLADAGIDAVKTDCQYFLDILEKVEDRNNLINTYQEAWAIASSRYFHSTVISSMSQTPYILFRSQLATNRPCYLARNSDDFFPDDPSSHPWHIFCNAHNALFTQHLNILPDWDMFQTVHDYSGFHAAARCVSGGPIYITDEPGNHNVNLIKQMTARTPHGDTVILRPSAVGRSLTVYNSNRDGCFCKVGTYHKLAQPRDINTASITGIFNVSDRALTEFIRLDEFLEVDGSAQYIIRAHSTGQVSSVMALNSIMPMVQLSLDVKGYEVLTAYPIRFLDLGGINGKLCLVKVVVLGLLDKMTGAAAVMSTGWCCQDDGGDHDSDRESDKSEYKESQNPGYRIWTSIKAFGTLGIYISDLQSRFRTDRLIIKVQGLVIPDETYDLAAVQECVLEIHLEAAWKVVGAKESGDDRERAGILVEVIIKA